MILPLSLPLFIRELVPCEASEGGRKDDYSGRVSLCPRQWVTFQITLWTAGGGDRAVAIPRDLHAHCVCVCVSESSQESQNTCPK